MAAIDLQVRFRVDDSALSALHGQAFGGDGSEVQPWGQRLERHSLTWVGAFDSSRLVGFVHACWDGGVHAFLRDTAVDPSRQRRGIGTAVVESLVAEVAAAGCQWLHVDYEPHLHHFYRERCGFHGTEAGLLRLGL
jgi:GNAT superfamily N-acetyltransferase